MSATRDWTVQQYRHELGGNQMQYCVFCSDMQNFPKYLLYSTKKGFFE